MKPHFEFTHYKNELARDTTQVTFVDNENNKNCQIQFSQREYDNNVHGLIDDANMPNFSISTHEAIAYLLSNILLEDQSVRNLYNNQTVEVHSWQISSIVEKLRSWCVSTNVYIDDEINMR